MIRRILASLFLVFLFIQAADAKPRVVFTDDRDVAANVFLSGRNHYRIALGVTAAGAATAIVGYSLASYADDVGDWNGANIGYGIAGLGLGATILGPVLMSAGSLRATAGATILIGKHIPTYRAVLGLICMSGAASLPIALATGSSVTGLISATAGTACAVGLPALQMREVRRGLGPVYPELVVYGSGFAVGARF